MPSSGSAPLPTPQSCCVACSHPHLQVQTGLELDPQYRLPKMRYKGQGGPPPQYIRVAPEVAAGAASTTADSGGAGNDGGHTTLGAGEGRAGGDRVPLIKEVRAAGEDEDGTPSFALLASKRQQRQSAAAAALRTKQQPLAPAPAAAADSGQQPRQQEGQQGQGEGLPQLQPRIEYQGKPATAVCISVSLPPAAAVTAVRHPASMQASVCAEVVRLRVPGCQPLEVQLPFAVTAAGGSAELAPDGKGSGAGASLLLRLPYRPFSNVLAELREAATAAEGQGSGAKTSRGSGLMDLD